MNSIENCSMTNYSLNFQGVKPKKVTLSDLKKLKIKSPNVGTKMLLTKAKTEHIIKNQNKYHVLHDILTKIRNFKIADKHQLILDNIKKSIENVSHNEGIRDIIDII